MAQHHARVIARLASDVQLVGVADPSAEAGAAMKAIVPDVQLFAGLGELLEALHPDVVHIVTPPQTHAALGRLALDAGCHTYIEKPFAPTAADAQDLLSHAKARGLVICAGHQLLYEAPALRMRQLLPALGAISHAESYFSFRTVRRSPDGRVPLRADLQLLDILPHPVYLLLSALEAAGPGQTELTASEIGTGGTIHALMRRGTTTGVLTVTLEGRPIESYLRVVGSNGSVCADFVRGTVQLHIGPGTSGIDKLLAPYRLAWQLGTGTTGALARRFMKRQRYYPGLTELFAAFYKAARGGAESPMSDDSVLQSVRVWEHVADGLARLDAQARQQRPVSERPAIVVTGGTGLLGRALVSQADEARRSVTVVARRLPASWDYQPGARYLVANLARAETLTGVFDGASLVIHCAAETAGGWPEHQANSIDATENALRAAAAAGVRHFIHVSSMAVLPPPSRQRPTFEGTAPYEDSHGAGPYVWGKLESERLAVRLGGELSVAVKVVRPGALVDYARFDPPGRLGRRVGNLFVAAGARGDTIGVVDVDFAAKILLWIAEHFDTTPEILNLVSPTPPTRRDLVNRLKRANPGLYVLWLPTPVVQVLSGLFSVVQRVLRPRKPAMSLARAFAGQRLDTTVVSMVAAQMCDDAPRHAVSVTRAQSDTPAEGATARRASPS
jgi:predicted dehydrogenase/nucleoside-diphosphate-sugar epimerase